MVLYILPTTVSFLQVFAVCCRTCNFLRLLADRILIFSRLKLLQIKCNVTSFHRLRVLAVQELLAPLLAHALFLGCTVHVACSCTTSCACIIFGLYCVCCVFLHHFLRMHYFWAVLYMHCTCTVHVYVVHSFKLFVLCANLSPHTFYHSLSLCSSQVNLASRNFLTCTCNHLHLKI